MSVVTLEEILKKNLSSEHREDFKTENLILKLSLSILGEIYLLSQNGYVDSTCNRILNSGNSLDVMCKIVHKIIREYYSIENSVSLIMESLELDKNMKLLNEYIRLKKELESTNKITERLDSKVEIIAVNVENIFERINNFEDEMKDYILEVMSTLIPRMLEDYLVKLKYGM